jgi:hypothetical protein
MEDGAPKRRAADHDLTRIGGTEYQWAMKMSSKVLLVGLSSCTLMCGTQPILKDQTDAVQKRAVFDLDCAQVKVLQLGHRTFGVTGCGKRATYLTQGVCGASACISGCTCTAVMNTDQHTDK